MGYNRFTRARGLFGGVDTKQVSEVANGASGVYAQITQGSTALTGTLRGLYAVATNGTTTGTGTIRGAEIKARAADAAGVGANVAGLTGVYVSVDVKAKVGTTIRGFEVSLDGGAGGSSTLAQGLVIFNNSSAAQTTAIAVDVNGGTPTGHKAFTADFRLQNGALVDNAVSGVLAFTVAAITFSGTLNVVGNFSVNTDRFTVNATSADLSSYNQEADATGTTWTVKKSRAAGAAAVASDVVLDIIAQGMNSTPALKSVAEIQAIITDVIAGTEDGKLSFLTMVAGAALAEKLAISNVVNSTVDFQVNTDKFVVTASSGATVIKSTLGVGTGGTTFTVAADGSLAIATTGFTVSAAGLAVAASRVDAKGGFKGGTNLTEFVVGTDGSIAVVSTKFTVSAAGAVSAKGAIAFGANLTEFTVSTAGATAIASTLGVTGDFAVNTSYFVVTALTGDVAQKNVEVDATGVTTTATKARAAAVCVANDVIWQLISSGMNSTPAQKAVVNLKTIMTAVGVGTEAGAFTVETVVAGAAISEAFRVGATVNSARDFTVNTDDFIVDIDGNITLAPTGGDVNVTGDIVQTGNQEVTGQVDVSKTSTAAGGTFGLNADITQGTGVGLTGTLRGGYFTATNGDTAASGAIRGIEVKARAANSATPHVGSTVALLQAGYFSADAKNKEATTLRGLEVELAGEGAATSTLAQGVVIFNNSSGTQTTSVGLDVNGGTVTGHKVFTYDLRLQNGSTIGNATSGIVAISDALEVETIQATATGNLFLESVAINKTVRINSRTFTGTDTDSIIGMQVKPRAGDNRTAGIFGAEFEPGINEGFTGTDLIGLAARPVIKASGATPGGNLSGDVRAFEAAVSTYDTSTRTVGGTMSALWASNNAYGTITGGVYVIHVPAAGGGTVPWAGFAKLPEDNAMAGLVSAQALPACAAWVRVKIGTTFFRIAAYDNA